MKNNIINIMIASDKKVPPQLGRLERLRMG